MSDEADFFIYLLESYAQSRGRLSRDVLREWDERGITQEIFDGYWGYHTDDIRNAFDDIDSPMLTGEHAW